MRAPWQRTGGSKKVRRSPDIKLGAHAMRCREHGQRLAQRYYRSRLLAAVCGFDGFHAEMTSDSESRLQPHLCMPVGQWHLYRPGLGASGPPATELAVRNPRASGRCECAQAGVLQGGPGFFKFGDRAHSRGLSRAWRPRLMPPPWPFGGLRLPLAGGRRHGRRAAMPGQVRSGQVRYITSTRPLWQKSTRTMRVTR